MDKVSFSKVEVDCGCLGDFVTMLLRKDCQNVFIKVHDTDFDVFFAWPDSKIKN